jgi:hypothetical protein
MQIPRSGAAWLARSDPPSPPSPPPPLTSAAAFLQPTPASPPTSHSPSRPPKAKPKKAVGKKAVPPAAPWILERLHSSYCVTLTDAMTAPGGASDTFGVSWPEVVTDTTLLSALGGLVFRRKGIRVDDRESLTFHHKGRILDMSKTVSEELSGAYSTVYFTYSHRGRTPSLPWACSFTQSPSFRGDPLLGSFLSEA